jgi:hypothetical protein
VHDKHSSTMLAGFSWCIVLGSFRVLLEDMMKRLDSL